MPIQEHIRNFNQRLYASTGQLYEDLIKILTVRNHTFYSNLESNAWFNAENLLHINPVVREYQQHQDQFRVSNLEYGCQLFHFYQDESICTFFNPKRLKFCSIFKRRILVVTTTGEPKQLIDRYTQYTDPDFEALMTRVEAAIRKGHALQNKTQTKPYDQRTRTSLSTIINSLR